METVLLGFKRHMVPLPWGLFTRFAKKEAKKANAKLGRLDDDERRVHHFVVRELPGYAQPMGPRHISEALHMPLDQVIEIVDELERRLIFLFRPNTRDVEWAYPVTVADTPHKVVFSTGERLNAA